MRLIVNIWNSFKDPIHIIKKSVLKWGAMRKIQPFFFNKISFFQGSRFFLFASRSNQHLVFFFWNLWRMPSLAERHGETTLLIQKKNLLFSSWRFFIQIERVKMSLDSFKLGLVRILVKQKFNKIKEGSLSKFNSNFMISKALKNYCWKVDQMTDPDCE